MLTLAKRAKNLIRKRVGQAGVLLYIVSLLEFIFLPFFPFWFGIPFWPGILSIVLYWVLTSSGGFLLTVAAFLPRSEDEEWGSM